MYNNMINLVWDFKLKFNYENAKSELFENK